MRVVVLALVLGFVLVPVSPARAATPIERAEQILRTVTQTRDRERRFQLAAEAESLCEQAMRERPRDPVPHIMLARVLTITDPEHPEACREKGCERAAEELKRARRLDVDGVEAERIAGELGLVLSRLTEYEEALAEYDRALRLVDSERRPSVFDEGGRSVLYSNSAETLMALGRLPEAIERYRRAVTVATPGDLEWELAEWGLGVALDRDQQVDRARRAIARALDFDPTMSHLSDESVFFEPAGDKRYYEGLGHEVAGDHDLARAAFSAFLAEAPHSRYRARAEQHLADAKDARPVKPAFDRARLHVAIGEISDFRGVRSTIALRQTIERHADELSLCYARALRADASLRGELRLQLLLDPSGYLVARAHVLLSTVGSESLSHCVELAASAWRFPTSEVLEPEDVVVTLLFAR